MDSENSNSVDREMTLGEILQSEIRNTDYMVKRLIDAEKKSAPPVVQEITLARRHVEDSYFRLKKAYNSLPDGMK